MTDCCPNCGHPLGLAAESPVDALERACRERGLWVSLDGRVTEAVAAELVGRAPGTLRNWALGEQPLPFVRIRGSRTYRLTDIAAFMQGDGGF